MKGVTAPMSRARTSQVLDLPGGSPAVRGPRGANGAGAVPMPTLLELSQESSAETLAAAPSLAPERPVPTSALPPSDLVDSGRSLGAVASVAAASVAASTDGDVVDTAVARDRSAARDLAPGSPAAEATGTHGDETRRAETPDADGSPADGSAPGAGTGVSTVDAVAGGEPVPADWVAPAVLAPPESARGDVSPADVSAAEVPRAEASEVESGRSAGPAPGGLGQASLGAKPGRPRTGPRSLDNTLTSTIRRWAKPTTPRELEARGVKRVRSVSMSRIASLIEKAINRELIARTLDGDTDDALSLSVNAREGFLELARGEMSGGVDVGADSSALADLDRLRGELEASRAELEERGRIRSGAEVGVEDEALELRLRAVFASRPGAADPELERDVVQAALDELSEMRGRAAERRQAEGRRETRQLERRIAKLAGLLEQTEGELRRTRARGAPDPGVASIYAEVQGLDAGDGRHEQKKDLMKCIFEANLELQR